MSSRRYRVVQWATGNIGTRALREVIRHPALDLVGVLVYDPTKDGVDAGDLCGEEPVGVAATTDPGAIVALGADCVLYMPRALDLDDVVALLESGTNVVTTRGEFFAGGRRLADEDRAPCARRVRGGQLVDLRDGKQPRLHHRRAPVRVAVDAAPRRSIEIEEFANLSRRDSPHLLFELMGFGRPIDVVRPAPVGVPPRRVRAVARAARGGRGPARRRLDERG